MAFIFGTSTNYQTFADMLSRVAIGTSLQAISAVAVAGTGYVVGDIVTVDGGTSDVGASIEVLTVGGGGEILTARIRNAGLYTTTPANDATVSGGTGSGAEFTLTWDTNGWVRRRAEGCPSAVQSAAVAAGGTGYTVGDILTVSGGTFGHAATLRVLTAPAGVVGTVEVVDPGDYSAAPSNPASTTGGTGTSCTVNLTMGTGEVTVIVEGEGSGSDEIYLGWKTFFDSGSGARNMVLHGFTGFESAITYNDQPGRSPGLETATSGADFGGCYMLLSNATVTWWIRVTPRAIVCVAKIGTCYSWGGGGFVNPYATSGEWPYPIWVGGTTDLRFALPGTAQIQTGGFPDPVSSISAQARCLQVRTADGSWNSGYNSIVGSGATRNSRTDGVQTYPAGSYNLSAVGTPSEDQWYSTSVSWPQFIPTAGSPGTQTSRLLRSQFTGGDRFLRIPVTVMEGTPVQAILGEIEGIFWFDVAATGLVAENRLIEGADRYTVFPLGTRGDNWAHYALKED